MRLGMEHSKRQIYSLGDKWETALARNESMLIG